MYYNKNQNSNDYYRSYKKSMQEKEENSPLKKMLQLPLIISALGILSVGSVYLLDYFSTEEKSPIKIVKEPIFSQKIKEKILTKELRESNESNKQILPKSIQLQEFYTNNTPQRTINATDFEKEALISSQKNKEKVMSQVSNLSHSVNINPKDIELIVQIIMTQMNNSTDSNLEEQLLHAENQTMVKKDLKEVNHYNKVVINSNINSNDSSELIQLRSDLNKMLTDTNNEKNKSDYSLSLEEEINVRKNEMKIIIVKQGDTLSKIAKKAYGNPFAYPKIFQANPEVLKNPNQIFVGQKLRIPS